MLGKVALIICGLCFLLALFYVAVAAADEIKIPYAHRAASGNARKDSGIGVVAESPTANGIRGSLCSNVRNMKVNANKLVRRLNTIGHSIECLVEKPYNAFGDPFKRAEHGLVVLSQDSIIRDGTIALPIAPHSRLPLTMCQNGIASNNCAIGG